MLSDVATDDLELTSAYAPLVDTRLRVLTWNLWWQFGPWEQRQPAIRTTLVGLQPDVVCLQECWPDQVESLAGALGYEWAYSTRFDLDGVPFGNAVLSRWPITGSEWRPLPSPPDRDEMRTVLRADIEGPRGALQVFSTHLHWRFDHSAIRQDQVRTIYAFVDESKPAGGRDVPPIVGGDFNADPTSDEIRLMTGRSAPPVDRLVFHDAWEAANRPPDPGWTWWNGNPYAALDLEPNRRIDYVFVGWPKPGGVGHVLACEVVGADPIDGVVPSDHLGVLAELRY